MNKLIKCLNNLDDDLVIEALEYTPKKKVNFSFKLVSSLVIASLIFTLVLARPNISSDNSITSNTTNEVNRPSNGLLSTRPMHLLYNNNHYISDGTKLDKLPRGFKKKAVIEKTLAYNELVNNSSTDLSKGDILYLSSDLKTIYACSKLNQDKAYYYRFILVKEDE